LRWKVFAGAMKVCGRRNWFCRSWMYQALTEADGSHLREFANQKRIIVCNKVDLDRKFVIPEDFEDIPIVEISCKTGVGIEALKYAIKNLVWSGEINSEMLQAMINSRHQDALNRARAAVLRTIAALRAGATLELAAMDLRIAVNAVGEIVGKTTTEDLLDMIFSQFCIGK